MVRKHLLWAVPLLLLVLAFLAGLLALPAFVSAPTHRMTVETFASQLIGRDVHISGQLSLSYLPRPEITATGITITGPDHEIITARALSLEISLKALLRGRFGARTLRLESPVISYPWPIPGGINDIAPPPWLAALHAQITDGQVRIGGVDFTNVEADLLTGAGGRVRVTGTGRLDQHPITLTFAIGQTASVGGTPLSVRTDFDGIQATLTGSLDTNSLLSGQLFLLMPNGATSHMELALNATGLNATNMVFQQGSAHLSGHASLTFAPLQLTATLMGKNLDLDHLQPFKPLWPQNLPARISLSASDIKLRGHLFPSLDTIIITSAAGTAFQNLVLGLHAAANLKGDLLLTPTRALSGHLTLVVPDFNAFMASLGLPAEKDWSTAVLRATLQGTESAPQFTDISGILGHDHVAGRLVVFANHVAFQVHFNRLALFPLALFLHQAQIGRGLTADGELTSAQTQAGPVRLNNLFIDANFDNGLNIRRMTADLGGGMAGGSMVLDDHLIITSAHLFLSLPTAAPLATALFPHLKLPQAFLNQRFSLIAAAAGTSKTISTAAVAHLGALTFTTTSLINIATPSAAGALSFSAPNAIETLKMLGVIDGCARMAPLPDYPFQDIDQPCIAHANNPALAFPGPGSLSLRAHFVATPDTFGLTDFIFSGGLLNASGRLNWKQDRLTGQIAAGTLAFPAIPLNATVPENLPVSGQIALSANQIIYDGQSVLGPSSGILTLTPDQISLTGIKAGLGQGIISGSIGLKLSPTSMPILTAKLTAADINASDLTLPQSFPFRLTQGQLNATADLSASGYTAKTWAATLGGSASLDAKTGELDGISLPHIVTAMMTSKRDETRLWMAHGQTPFTTLNLTATLSQGNCTLTQASLTSPAGTLTAVGGIDLFDSSLALRLEAHPALQPPLALATRLIGSWAHPSRTTDIGATLSWLAAPPHATAQH